ncbi:MAG: M48 family metalloprotease [Rhodoferax sp.]|nr:M48 family metalloprotease [Rhodoferax sp.]
MAPSVPVRPSAGQLPALGDGSELGAAAERRIGDRIAREIYRDPDYLDDPVLVEYVDGVWKPLLAAARSRGDISAELEERFAWEVVLGRDRSINAFALPGGYLGVHLGLIAVVSSRDELASVLAHELSHVTQRHISRLTSKQSEQRPWLIGAMILGALAASKSPDAANALLAGGQAVAIQNQLNFSRDMEREADRVGFGVMTQAGFAPQGFVSMFDKLQQASRLNDNGSFPYLRGHPLTSERIADMQSRQPAGVAGVVEITLEHAMVSARARVLSNPGVDILRQLVADAAPELIIDVFSVRQAGVLYAGALAAAKLREFPAARNAANRLNGLVRAAPAAQRLATLLTAEVAQQAGDPVPDLKPLGRPELFLSAQSQIGRGNAAQAAQSLSAWLATHPRDAGAWQLLSVASAAQGQALRAIRADAEARVAQLDFAGALERFKAAQILLRNTQSAGLDHIEASIIDTRTRAVQLLFREQSLER